MAKIIMVQGTMSNAGKSLLAAGLCRVFKQDGYRAAPFKSQNMALNSFITKDGLEMGRAQVMQAEAAGICPDVSMNPILLKPTGDSFSQVIVNGEVAGNMTAREYFKHKKELIPDVIKAFKKLEESVDIIVVEGAGSPAEINLKDDDIVNMGLAKMLGAPVLLVGDIDRGGVFAQLLGTLMLLEDDEKELVKGLIINKFRGDRTILDPGIKMLEEKAGIPVTGVVPYTPFALEDEDSLTERFEGGRPGLIDIAVIRYPRISNFTDMNVFEQIEGVSVRYVNSARRLGNPDMIVLPGSKNTMDDLKWMRESGLEAAVKKLSASVPVFGICGGYQMLGAEISDPYGVESGGSMRGMELLPVSTTLLVEKTRRQTAGRLGDAGGIFSGISGMDFEGYEIHMGRTVIQSTEYDTESGAEANISKLYDESEYAGDKLSVSGNEDIIKYKADKLQKKQALESKNNCREVINCGNIYGTYIHAIFDKGDIAGAIIKALAEKKGVELPEEGVADYSAVKEREYDRLADIVRSSIDMDAVYAMLKEAKI